MLLITESKDRFAIDVDNIGSIQPLEIDGEFKLEIFYKRAIGPNVAGVELAYKSQLGRDRDHDNIVFEVNSAEIAKMK